METKDRVGDLSTFPCIDFSEFFAILFSYFFLEFYFFSKGFLGFPLRFFAIIAIFLRLSFFKRTYSS